MLFLACLLFNVNAQHSSAARPAKKVEHTPFHKLDKWGHLIDVRDDRITFNRVREELDTNISVSANVSNVANGDPVRISWKSNRGSLFDVIAIYTPPSRDSKDYLDFRYTSETRKDPNSGWFEEILFNMRADYEIRYLAIDKQQVATVKAKYLITVPENEPMHGHIAVTGRAGEMRVMWNSAKPDSPTVWVSQSPDLSGAEDFPAKTTTYRASDMCGPRANETGPILFQDPGFFHTALLTDLKPMIRYYYRFGSGKALSPVASFTSAPYPTTKMRTTRFIGFGDMGTFYPPYNADSIGALDVTKMMEKEIPETNFILHFGDISYARGRGYIWDQFMTQMEVVAMAVPYMVGVGNHEYDHIQGGEKDPSGAEGQGFHPDWGNLGDDGHGECGVATVHRYPSPENGNGVFWYSFDYGLMHIVQFSSEHDFTPGSRQYEWLAKDLSSVDRERTPWVIATSHRAMYTSQEQMGDHIVGLHMRLALEDMFYNNKVNLHLSGHYHSYERTCQVVEGDCVQHGTVYSVVGTSGKALDPQFYLDYKWSESQICDKFGYQRVTANHTHMDIEFVTTPHGHVVDSITVPVWN